jgi:hypothetical protein
VSRFEVINCDQRSEVWYESRCGRLTGSVAADMMRKIKSGAFSTSRKHLLMRLALEQVTRRPQEKGFTTAAVQHGIDQEPAALSRYEAETGEIIERVGFLSLGPVMAGCSLDAFVDDRRGIVEVKCPESATHYEYIKTRKIPEDYRWQCIHNMWVSGADYADFISYDPRFPAKLQYLCVRLERDEKEMQAYEDAALRFLAEVSIEGREINKLLEAA